MASKATGVDVGLRSGVFICGRVQGNTFTVTDFAYRPIEADNLEEAWSQCDPDFAPTRAIVGVTGKEVNLRYSRVPRLADWQLRKLMRFEVESLGDSSDTDVAADFNVLPELPELESEDVVLLSVARETLLDVHGAGLADVKGTLGWYSPNAIGLYNAWLRFGVVLDDTVLIASIGHENVDAVLVRGADLLFARNLSGGGGLFDTAIAERFGVELSQAERIKRGSVDLTPGATFPDGNSERASRAASAPAGQLLSLLQSTVMFAKAQVKLSNLKLDRVFLCGGGARLKGLDKYLEAALGVPVAPFDAFQVVDTSKLGAEAAAELEVHALEAVTALGLATAGSDPDAYGIEILPEAVAKRREFFGGTLLLIAAAALGLLFLGWDYQRRSAALEVTQEQAAKLGTQVRREEEASASARELLAENESLSAEALELQLLLTSGDQAVRTLQAIDGALPTNFWLDSISSEFSKDEQLGFGPGNEGPALRIEGRVREGISDNSIAFETFVAKLRESLPGLRIVESMGSRQDTFSLSVVPGADPLSASAAEGADETSIEEAR